MRLIIAALVTGLCVGVTARLSVAQDARGNAYMQSTGMQKPAVTVAGKWHFVLDTQGGDRIVEAHFEQNGKNVTGNFGKDDVKGTFADGKLNLDFPVNSEEAGPGTLKLTGELAADTMTGKWEFQEYGGTFKATRTE